MEVILGNHFSDLILSRFFSMYQLYGYYYKFVSKYWYMQCKRAFLLQFKQTSFVFARQIPSCTFFETVKFTSLCSEDTYFCSAHMCFESKYLKRCHICSRSMCSDQFLSPFDSNCKACYALNQCGVCLTLKLTKTCPSCKKEVCYVCQEKHGNRGCPGYYCTLLCNFKS